MPAPLSIARRYAIAVSCHDECWGYKRRPLSVNDRHAWALIVSCWPKRGKLTYTAVREIARALGRDPNRPQDDAALRVEFARRLRAVAEHRPGFTPWQRKHGRIKALVEEIFRADERLSDLL